MTTKVYKYGLLPPHENAALVNEYMYRTHRYKNALIELEREKRLKASGLLAEAVEIALPGFQQSIEDLECELKELKEQGQKDKLKEVNAALKLKRKAVKEAKALIKEDTDIQERLKACSDEANEKVKALRKKEADIPWGSRGFEERCLRMAQKAKGLPKFKRWEGNGHLTVSIQKQKDKPEITQESLFTNSSTQVQIQRVPVEAWESPSRSVRRKAARTELKLRIASCNKAGEIIAGGRIPLWAAFKMIMHRPLPEDGIIKGVQVQKIKTANHYKWHAIITIDIPDPVPVSNVAKAIALDIGWRKVPLGLRVAYWYDGDKEGELVIPSDLLSAIQKCNEIRSIRDLNFDKARDALVAWKKDRELPEWFKEATRALHAWKSTNRLAGLLYRWRENRIEGDETILELLDGSDRKAWRRHDLHLWQWEAHGRKKALRRRKEIFRVWAAKFAQQYDACFFEDINLSKLAQAKGLFKAAQSQRVEAATSILVGAFENAFKREGKHALKVPAQYTTTTCHVCGFVNTFEHNALVQVCASCKNSWDMDKNAAYNIHARGMEAVL